MPLASTPGCIKKFLSSADKKEFITLSGNESKGIKSLFSNEYWITFNKRISPDVFVAFCAEAAYIYSCKAIKKDWVIVSDLQVRHVKAIEAPCIPSLPVFEPT